MQNLLKYIVLGIYILSLTVFIGISPGFTSQGRNEAIKYTQNGYSLMDRGQPKSALKSWENAYEIYRKEQDINGITGSLINQGIALKALGYLPLACAKDSQALNIEDDICRSRGENPESFSKILNSIRRNQKISKSLLIICFQELGDSLRRIGKYDYSRVALKTSIEIGTELATDTTLTKLHLANTEFNQFSKEKEFYLSSNDELSRKLKIKDLVNKVIITSRLYEEVINYSIINNKSIVLKSKINLLRLYQDFEGWRHNTSSFYDFTNEELPFSKEKQLDLINNINNDNFHSLTPIDEVYAQLGFSQILSDYCSNIYYEKLCSISLALDNASAALNKSEAIKNSRARSYAFTMLAKLYAKSGNSSLALDLLNKAKALALAIQAPEILFQVDADLGEILFKKGDILNAKEAYESSIKTIETLRGNFFSINSDSLLSFTKDFEPVYKNYLKLLLLKTPDLSKAIKVNDLLHIAQIENFLACNKLDLVPLTRSDRSSVLPPIIYTLNLGENIEIILRTSDGTLHRHSASQKVITQISNNLSTYLQNDNLFEYDESLFKPYLQSLYGEIIKPLKEFLPKSGTLIFSQDDSFQNIPISLLHDGNNYLLENYSIVNSIGSEIPSKNSSSSFNRNVLIGGISDSSPSFTDSSAPKGLQAIPQVLQEVSEIKNFINKYDILIDKDFTVENFQNALSQSSYKIIHLSTHGQFSSNFKDSVLLAWDKVINVRDIDQIIKSSTANFNPIDLIVFSACQTAKGDSRSSLGIAGFAAQSGARSVLATLWKADANASVIFMKNFYQELHIAVLNQL